MIKSVTQMPKVLLVSPTGILGGAERVLHSVATYLVDRGWDVTFYIMSRGGQPGWDDLVAQENFRLIISSSPSEKKSLPKFLISIIKLSKEEGFDFVFSSHTHINALLSLFKRIGALKVKYLVGRESTFIFERFVGLKRRAFYCLYRFFYGSHDVLICQTLNMKTSLESALGFSPAKKVLVVPNPINIKRIDEGLSSGDVFHAVPDGAKKIICCGRLVPIKGFYLLLEAFSRLRISGFNVFLVIVGDGPEKERLIEAASRLGVENEVFFAGHQLNPAAWFDGADVGVISSEREGFPNVVLEMMAARVKRIVSTPCTDGLSILPEIDIASEYSVAALSLSLAKVLRENTDNSNEYRKYVDNNRSVSAFWAEIERGIGINE